MRKISLDRSANAEIGTLSSVQTLLLSRATQQQESDPKAPISQARQFTPDSRRTPSRYRMINSPFSGTGFEILFSDRTLGRAIRSKNFAPDSGILDVDRLSPDGASPIWGVAISYHFQPLSAKRLSRLPLDEEPSHVM
jgi:hypothetical protein